MSEDKLRLAIKSRSPTFFPKRYDLGDFNMFDMANLYRTHPSGKNNDLIIINEKKKRVDMKAFGLRSSAPQCLQDVLPMLRQYRPVENRVTSIAFMSFTADGKSFDIHRDSMDVYYVQAVGQVTWTFWDIRDDIEAHAATPEDGTIIEQRVLNPGDAVWAPRGVWHHVTVTEPRAGVSYGIEGPVDPSTI